MIARSLCLLPGTSALATLLLVGLGWLAGAGAPSHLSQWAWGWGGMVSLGLVPALVLGWCAGRVQGTWRRRWSLLAALATAFVMLGLGGAWLFAGRPGDDPLAFAESRHFVPTLAVSVLLPTYAAMGLLARWSLRLSSAAR